MVAGEPIAQEQYVCEYKTNRVYPLGSEVNSHLADEYEMNGEGSFVVKMAYNVPGVGRLCFDATHRYRGVNCLINHSPTPQANLRLHHPYHIHGKWRIRLTARCDIQSGEELTCDYGVRSETWMKVCPSAAETKNGEERENKEIKKEVESEKEG